VTETHHPEPDKQPGETPRKSTPRKKVSDKRVIGRTEKVDLPDWHINGLNAKVDTGAKTSALHVENIHYMLDEFVRFDIVLSRKRADHRVRHITAKIHRWGRVRSSTGQFSTRPFIYTLLRIGPVTKRIELSLVSREKMLYRMLLGREALEDDFLVDVSRRNVLSKKKAPKHG